MSFKAILTAIVFTGSLLFVALQDADAARLGGGRSFGSKPSMQRSTVAPTQQKPPMAQAAPGAQAQKPGLLGGMGGMLGGVLAGTLLGSLLFGGGFSGGGFMDILMFGLLLFVAFKLFSHFRNRSTASATSGRTATAGGPDAGPMQYQASEERPQQASGMWGNLKQEPEAAPAGPQVPAGFDVDDFLRGAKMAFARLQASWDKRDMDDIAQFASESVLKEVKAQFEADPTPGKTEILLTNAQLLSVTDEGDAQQASVFFDVLLREAPNTDTTQVREVWHFTRPVAGGSWKLDGIQQVEA